MKCVGICTKCVHYYSWQYSFRHSWFMSSVFYWKIDRHSLLVSSLDIAVVSLFETYYAIWFHGSQQDQGMSKHIIDSFVVLLPEASFGLWVLSSPASVCLLVCPYVCINHLLVRPITHQLFKLESPNSDQRCKAPWLRCLKFLGWLTLTFKVKSNLKVEFHLDWPWSSRSNLTCKSIFIPFWACLYNNLLPVQARITKFGPEMLLNTVKIPIDFGHDKSSASISFLIVKAVFLTYLHCFCITLSKNKL